MEKLCMAGEWNKARSGSEVRFWTLAKLASGAEFDCIGEEFEVLIRAFDRAGGKSKS